MNGWLADAEGWINPGLSVIVDPDGKVVAGPLDSAEGILYADFLSPARTSAHDHPR